MYESALFSLKWHSHTPLSLVFSSERAKNSIKNTNRIYRNIMKPAHVGDDEGMSVVALKMGPTNCYLLKADDGYLQIDTSLPEYYQAFLKQLETIKIQPTEIKYLLLTHSHDDHAGFAAELRALAKCKIIAHKNATESLKEGCIIKVGQFLNTQAKITMKLYNWTKRRTFEYTPITLAEQDTIIEDDNSDVLKNIGIDGKIIYTPGHTDDSISVILNDGNACVGDVCMSNLGFLHYRPIEVSDISQVFKSWQKIIDSNAKTLWPAHGKPFKTEELIKYKGKFTSKNMS